MADEDLTRAIRGFRGFREASPVRAQYVKPKVPRALWRMGVCEFIGYMTTHKGRTALYVHEFAPGSRPLLYTGVGRNQLFLVGGRYKVTAAGITDMDARGRITEGPRRYNTRLMNRRSRYRSR